MRTFAILMLIVLLTGAVMGQDEAPARSGLRPDAPPYAVRGPYPVGYQTMVIESGSYPLTVAVWYPALNPDGLEEKITYPAVPAKFEGMPSDYLMPSYGRALQDAAPDAAGGPYPLVIFSHGFASYAYAFAYSTEQLASYGFVVFGPDHPEIWDPTYKDIPAASVNRPMDVQRTITLAETATAEGGALAGMIDTNQIAVAGHSYGGFTALLMGGARFDFEALKTTCAPLPADHTIGALCVPLLAQPAEMAKLAGLDAVPEGLWPSWNDPRIKAIIASAGETELMGAKGLAEITIPVLLVNGSGDQTVPMEWGVTPTWKHISSPRKASVLLQNADHTVFAEKCANFPWPLEIGWYAGCSDPVWDLDRAHDLFDHFSTAFLLAELKGDADAKAALAASAVSFPGVTYEVVGY
ncbi:MAG: hypothetical protein JNM70_00610 [Anaerolineae bacterium]|nr:hypothetical protein [Anaerolineae bacterium]